MSPAIKGDSTTAHTRSSKHTPLPTPTIPLTSVLEIDPLPNLGQLWAVEDWVQQFHPNLNCTVTENEFSCCPQLPALVCNSCCSCTTVTIPAGGCDGGGDGGGTGLSSPASGPVYNPCEEQQYA